MHGPGLGPAWLVVNVCGHRKSVVAFNRVGANCGAGSPARGRRSAVHYAADSLRVSGNRRLPAPLAAFERANNFYHSRDDAFGRAHTLVRLARVLAQMGRFDESASALKEAFPVIERAGLPKILGVYFTNSAFLKMLKGDARGARAQYEKALSLFRDAGVEFAMLASLANLAGVNWQLGDLPGAADAYRQSIAMLRQAPTSRKNSLGFALANLSGVLTERGDLDEALAAAREAVPLLDDGDYAWSFLDHFALRMALSGNIEDAARVVGHADAIRTTRKTLREPEDARARDRLDVLLRERLDPGALERLLVEGAKLAGEDACRLAVQRSRKILRQSRETALAAGCKKETQREG